MNDGALSAVVAVVTFVVGTVFLLLQVGLAAPVVREHCADDLQSIVATQEVQIDSKWTFIMWPPLYFAPLDPAGRCVRNSLAREFADTIGVWKLPDAKEQVRQHVFEQLRISERPNRASARRRSTRPPPPRRHHRQRPTR
jgi:hypothetical protein